MPWRRNCEVRMERNEYLSLLGLALRGGNLVAGADAAADAARVKAARLLLISADASPRTRRFAEHLSLSGSCLLLELPCTKAELGRALGRAEASITALKDAGLAAAVGRRLAALDPERYGAASERLEIKTRRAKERRIRREEELTRKTAEARRTPDRKRPSRGRDRPPAQDTAQGGRAYKAYKAYKERTQGDRARSDNAAQNGRVYKERSQGDRAPGDKSHSGKAYRSTAYRGQGQRGFRKSGSKAPPVGEQEDRRGLRGREKPPAPRSRGRPERRGVQNTAQRRNNPSPRVGS